MNNDVECFYNLSHVVFFLIRPRFVEQLRQGSQELGSECAVASRQRLLLVLVLFICTQTCNTKHIPGIYISIVWDIGYFMDILYIPCICVLYLFCCYKHSGFWMLELDFFSQNLATKWGVFFCVSDIGESVAKEQLWWGLGGRRGRGRWKFLNFNTPMNDLCPSDLHGS